MSDLHELSGDFGIARAYEIAKMNFISLQLRDSISAAQLGIRGSATSASPGAETYGGRYPAERNRSGRDVAA